MSISYDEVISIDDQTMASVHVCVLCRIGVEFSRNHYFYILGNNWSKKVFFICYEIMAYFEYILSISKNIFDSIS
jgi:hypothetical protein